MTQHTHPLLPNVRTVGELLKALEGVDPATAVVMSADAEGNNFSPLVEVDTNRRYQPYTTWSGECHQTTESVLADGRDLENEFHFGPDDGVDVIVLWPLN